MVGICRQSTVIIIINIIIVIISIINILIIIIIIIIVIIIIVTIITIIMVTQHIPTMTKSHHGEEMSVIMKVGMCQCQKPTIHQTPQ